MRLSTSSFERKLTETRWLSIFGCAFTICVSLAAIMEIRLAQLGYRPTVLDSKERWAEERSRVSKLGKQALILVGASRIQLGVDLDVLRDETGLEPIQLAVDGSSFIPTLKSLAEDTKVTGTVLVDYAPGALEGALSGDYGAAGAYVGAYEKLKISDSKYTLARVEKFLAESLHENFRSFADGTTPLSSFYDRIIPAKRASRYLITLPDRSRLADYQLVPMPAFYFWRVARNLSEERTINISAADAQAVLRQKIDVLKPHDNTAYIQGARYLKDLIAAIRSRGGEVVFIVMPTSGMIREIDDKLYPRANFFDLLAKEAGVTTFNSADDKILRAFSCPDGSHLDYRDRTKFTSNLVRMLGIGRHH